MTIMLKKLFAIDIKQMAEYSYLVYTPNNEFIPDITNRTGFDSGLLPIITPLANFENNRVDDINQWLEDISQEGQQTKIIDNSIVKYTGNFSCACLIFYYQSKTNCLVLQHLAIDHPKLFGVVAVTPNEDLNLNRTDIEVVKMVYKQQIVTVNIHR